MDSLQRNILLAVVVVLVVGAILYIQHIKSGPVITATNAEILRAPDASENGWIPQEQISENQSGQPASPSAESAMERLKKKILYPQAIELVQPDGYINTQPLTISENIGKKVILVDFWTYSCINCQRTLPYLNEWQEKYADKGLLIVGVHTPEFEFEKNYENVKKAVEKFGVRYPVVQDNSFQTWSAYKNHYWPHKYLIDIDGYIVYDHIGEGGYDETESEIQKLLKERSDVLGMQENISGELATPNTTSTDFSQIRTPEIYFGYEFNRGQFGNVEGRMPGKNVIYAFPQKIIPNKFYLQGIWTNSPETMDSVSQNASITLRYSAKNVNLVAGADKPQEIIIFVDGKETKRVMVSDFGLYPLVEGDAYGTHDIVVRVPNPGLMAYTFTFG